MKPTPFAIGSTDTVYHIKRLAGCERSAPLREHSVPVFRMHQGRPITEFLRGFLEKIEDALIHKLHRAICSHGVHVARYAVDDRANREMALPGNFFGAPSILNIREQEIPTHDSPVGSSLRKPTC